MGENSFCYKVCQYRMAHYNLYFLVVPSSHSPLDDDDVYAVVTEYKFTCLLIKSCASSVVAIRVLCYEKKGYRTDINMEINFLTSVVGCTRGDGISNETIRQ